jgi:hypothetical protein
MVTARFRVFSVFVVLEVGSRRILHWNVTEHPTAEWTIQQFRTVITPETSHRFVRHDRDSIFAATVDWAIASMGRHVLKTPVRRTPQAHAFCERLIGTMRRECLDWLIPIHGGHLRWISSRLGVPITGAAHTPAWDAGFPIGCPNATRSRPLVIASPNTLG